MRRPSPLCCCQPSVDLINAVNVTLSRCDLKLGRHERRKWWLCMCGIRPEIDQQQFCTLEHALANAAQERQVPFRRKHMNDVGDDDGVMPSR